MLLRTNIILILIFRNDFPSAWKNVITIKISKSGKCFFPVIYRLISLLNTIAKLTEIIIRARPQDEWYKWRIIADIQFSFRAQYDSQYCKRLDWQRWSSKNATGITFVMLAPLKHSTRTGIQHFYTSSPPKTWYRTSTASLETKHSK